MHAGSDGVRGSSGQSTDDCCAAHAPSCLWVAWKPLCGRPGGGGVLRAVPLPALRPPVPWPAGWRTLPGTVRGAPAGGYPPTPDTPWYCAGRTCRWVPTYPGHSLVLCRAHLQVGTHLPRTLPGTVQGAPAGGYPPTPDTPWYCAGRTCRWVPTYPGHSLVLCRAHLQVGTHLPRTLPGTVQGAPAGGYPPTPDTPWYCAGRTCRWVPTYPGHSLVLCRAHLQVGTHLPRTLPGTVQGAPAGGYPPTPDTPWYCAGRTCRWVPTYPGHSLVLCRAHLQVGAHLPRESGSLCVSRMLMTSQSRGCGHRRRSSPCCALASELLDDVTSWNLTDCSLQDSLGFADAEASEWLSHESVLRAKAGGKSRVMP